METVTFSDWTAAVAQLRSFTEVTLVGGEHEGTKLVFPYLWSAPNSKSHYISGGTKTVSVTETDGFRAGSFVYLFPRAINKLTLIQGGKLGKPNVFKRVDPVKRAMQKPRKK